MRGRGVMWAYLCDFLSIDDVVAMNDDDIFL